jgi:DNA modification methylase
MMEKYTIHHGDCLQVLATLPDNSVNCCVTSPPYFGLRDYGCDGQIGLEATPEAYVAKMVDVFREVRRVLRDDGTLWLNLGDSYASGQSNNGGCSEKSTLGGGGGKYRAGSKNEAAYNATKARPILHGVKPKDLIGIPWRVAFALQADGWYLRQDIIWHKPNPMPESVRDRCTKAHEYIFLLSKSARYWYDAEAVKENTDAPPDIRRRASTFNKQGNVGGHHGGAEIISTIGRNRRSVWTIATRPYKGAHFATFPPKLIEPCILAGCPKVGVVLDPFNGSGTTGQVALQHGRNYIGIELNEDYIALTEKRLNGIQISAL